MRQGTGFRAQGPRLMLAGSAALALLGSVVLAQSIQMGGDSTPKKGHVSLLSDVQEVPAGTPQVIELRFKVDEGYHVNSHTPKDELLIPTMLNLDKGAGVRVLNEEYPKGQAFKLDVGAGEVLDVYQGEFRVKVHLVAAKGEQTLTGSLKYQACDHAACYPPKTLPVQVALTGK